MNGTLTSTRLMLVPAMPEQVLKRWEGADGTFPPDISPVWIEQLRAARGPDPWLLGYFAFHQESNARIGSGGFKGAPDADGVVEIAYGIDEPHRGLGYATEVAGALVTFAFADSRVRLICAHTLSGAIASGRVLGKCGFARVPDVVDPEDGPVWRFERRRP